MINKGRFSAYNTLTRRFRKSVLRRDALVSVDQDFQVVSTAELKTYLEYDASDKDTLLVALLDTAVRQFESETSHYLNEQTREAEFWPPGGTYKVPAAPDLSLSTVEQTEEGTRTALDASDYFVKPGPPPLIVPKDYIANLSGELDGIIFTYTVGYADADSVPEPIKTVLKKMVVDLFEFRTSVHQDGNMPRELPMDWAHLLAPYRVPYLP